MTQKALHDDYFYNYEKPVLLHITEPLPAAANFNLGGNSAASSSPQKQTSKQQQQASPSKRRGLGATQALKQKLLRVSHAYATSVLTDCYGQHRYGPVARSR